MDLIRQGIQIAADPKQTRWLGPLLILADAALCAAIILKIPYTEIDWTTYMQHISLFVSGERNYAKLTGSTGPLVYPALHVYLYRILYSLTDNGTNIPRAQAIFTALYLAVLAVVITVYRRAGAPPWLLPLLVASKRLHSIFMLRLFNDCFAVGFLWVAMLFWQRRWWTLGSFALSAGVGVKMSLLLAVPGVGVVLWQALGLERGFQQGVLAGQFQVVMGYSFLLDSWYNYLTRAFEFSRQFLFKWTVNWRFVGEELFLSKLFSRGLLATLAILLLFFAKTRWLHVSFDGVLDQLEQPPSKEEQARIARLVTPKTLPTVVLSSVIIGCLCARSLHYQFYAYIFWSTPFLLWRSGLHPVVIYVLCAAQEWAWNVYPSTDVSSMVVVGCLAVTVASVWLGTESARKIHEAAEAEKKTK